MMKIASDLFCDLLVFGGIAAATNGIYMISAPGAWIFAGGSCMTLGLVSAWRK